MKRQTRVFATLGVLLLFAIPVSAQLSGDDLANRDELERFLADSEIGEAEQMPASEGVTLPFRLTLELDGEKRDALWKNPEGRVGGFMEGWKYEIAAYLLDKHLGLDMVPPTIEKRYKNVRGSCQIWVDAWMNMEKQIKDQVDPPSGKIRDFNNRVYLQRAFDNLIANEDRHLRNILITEDWRVILIDHSRSFRSSKKHTKRLIFTEKHRDGPKIMKRLPRGFLDKIKALDAASIREIVGDTLTDVEIEAMVLRRDLIVAEMDRLVKENGENATLY